MMACAACRWTALLLGIAVPAAAAPRPEVVPAGMFKLAGVPVRCGAARTMIAHIPDVAMTHGGLIILSPMLFSLPKPIQHFWYAHECAHHLLGADELAADCWAARTGRAKGWLDPSDVGWLERAFRGNPGDATHPPGHIRAANIKACYAG